MAPVCSVPETPAGWSQRNKVAVVSQFSFPRCPIVRYRETIWLLSVHSRKKVARPFSRLIPPMTRTSEFKLFKLGNKNCWNCWLKGTWITFIFVICKFEERGIFLKLVCPLEIYVSVAFLLKLWENQIRKPSQSGFNVWPSWPRLNWKVCDWHFTRKRLRDTWIERQ